MIAFRGVFCFLIVRVRAVGDKMDEQLTSYLYSLFVIAHQP